MLSEASLWSVIKVSAEVLDGGFFINDGNLQNRSQIHCYIFAPVADVRC